MMRFLVFVATLGPVFAQNGAIPLALGYNEPAPFPAAPGQVVTLFLDNVPKGLDGSNREAEAPAGDLPTSLAGISIRIAQGDRPEMQAGIFAVRQKRECGLSGFQAGDAACLLTLVKFQVPSELSGDLVLRDKTYAYAQPALLSIDVDGQRGRGFSLQPLPDNSHVLTTCDASWETQSAAVCDRLLYHSDNSRVTADAPAKAGETLFVLAYGLGKTNPAVPTGRLAPAGVALTDLIPGYGRVSLGIVTNFVNALSSAPRTPFNPDTGNATSVPISSSSLVPGQTGLYQVAFIAPPSKTALIPCGDQVRSNSILLVTTSQGVEGIAFCMQP